MKRLAYNVLVGVTTFAVVGILTSHGVGGWRLALLCVVLLAIAFRPRGDAAARRERRIERESDRFARLLTDTMEVVERGVAKVIHDRPPNCSPDLQLRSPSEEEAHSA